MTGIRTDTNETVATGHIMRCITIAKQLVRLGEEVRFFTADEQAAPFLQKDGFPFTVLHTSWERLEEELPVLLPALSEAGCDKILVDSYRATPAYLERLRRERKVIYIDDMFEAVYPADMVINYNAYHTLFPYEKTYAGGAKCLLGPSFAPLREQFSGPYAGAEEKDGVLVSCGGGDGYNVLPDILEEAKRSSLLHGCVFHTVVGRFHPGKERLLELAEKYPDIRLHQDVEEMARLMAKCRVAVSAAGTMLYELCAMRVPTVFFICADNQKYDSGYFARENRMLFAGDVRNGRRDCIGQIVRGLERLWRDGKLRSEMQRKLHDVTDGRGAQRIAAEITAL